eukprot:GCRY01003472.1.p1 GENE.GCRY01003472.1~~GCRY01003472.1.p1  ORF type:complete len:455 (+),score=107.25 GCRY01003472.1:180-1544(+)
MSEKVSLLASYFQKFSLHQFTQAAQLVKSRVSNHPVLNQFYSSLTLLCFCEEKLYSLSFFSEKRVKKDDSLENLFANTLNQVQNVVNTLQGPQSASLAKFDMELRALTGTSSRAECIEIMKQIQTLISTHQAFACLLRSLEQMALPFDYSDILSVVMRLHSDIGTALTHPVLAEFAAKITLEFKVFILLLQVQLGIDHFDFLNTIFRLFEVSSHLRHLVASFTVVFSSQIRLHALDFRSKSAPSHPHHAFLFWLIKYFNRLKAKVSFYFRNVLRSPWRDKEVTGVPQFNELASSLEDDYYQGMAYLVQKLGAVSAAVVFNSADSPVPYSATGYTMPDSDSSTPRTGLSSWPAVVAYPGDVPPMQYWPSVVSLLMEHEPHLRTYPDPLLYYEEGIDTAFFVTRVDERMSLVVVRRYSAAEKKKIINSTITDYLKKVATSLRCTRVFARLNPRCMI